ncbi:MAG: pseudouridine synthase [Bacteroidota bacterium]
MPYFCAMMRQATGCFIHFQSPIDSLSLPERFTFPFYYKPHPLSALAAIELQEYLLEQSDWEHNFGLETDQNGVALGKMFGVLVVQNRAGEIGYLAAFSGKLAGGNHHPGFVPPVFDVLVEDGFYRIGEEALNEMNRRIEGLEQNPKLQEISTLLQTETDAAQQQLDQKTARQRAAKSVREQRRAQHPTPEIEAELIAESKRDHFILKDLKKHWRARLEILQTELNQLLEEIQVLKEARKTKSAALQQAIFDRYYFLNQAGKQQSLADIFQRNAATPPPAGAGECAAPKLLQYAFLHDLKPITMAEFWWGASPVGEIRKHGHFYPACRGKCEPILGHMLEGIELDENPMMAGADTGSDIEILYEDAYLLVVNKPASLLSVPGKNIHDSVYFRLKKLYPEATGPMIVHRLDMSTSGLMLVAKTEAVYKDLQHQFLKRTIKKRYVAVLEGVIQADSGVIDLPLRVDLDDRPRQMVCYEHGKAARTEWNVVSRADGRTRIHFFPITGRTHQLRVHAAHPQGLNTPIMGDEIYGNKGERLCLHAEYLEFVHPVRGEKVVMEVGAGF